MTTGDRIRQIREKRGMTQEQLAKDADISKGFLSDVENAKRQIGSQGLLRIANILGASVDFLLTGEVSTNAEHEQIIIPPELSKVAEELNLTYSETLELLKVDRSVVARRGSKFRKELTAEQWKNLHKAIKGIFD